MEKIKKRYLEDWTIGDTFALKINNKEFEGRYFILIYIGSVLWDKKEMPIFRIKITEGSDLPSTKEEVDKLEYIKILEENFITRYFPTSGGETYEECVERKKNIKYDSDEFNYMYVYKTVLDIGRKSNYKQLIYIGNFDNIKEPVHEYHSDSMAKAIEYTHFPFLEESLIKSYKYYNLKESIIYDKKEKKRIDREAEMLVEATIKFDKVIKQLMKNEKK